MTLQDKIYYGALEIQSCIEKAKVLSKYIEDEEDSPFNSSTMAYFLGIMLNDVEKSAEEIERYSFKIKD